jgi:hypothetical protein
MARYTRMEITELSNRLEARADSVVNATPSAAGDMRAAAMLLRLMLGLADIQVVETGPSRCGLDDGRLPS